MASKAEHFQKELGEELASLFDGEFRFYRSKLELRRTRGEDADVIRLAGSNKYSPIISVSFCFGKYFGAVNAAEKRLNYEEPSSYHVHQYSPNVLGMKGLEYEGPSTWRVDIQNPPVNLATEIKAAIEGMAYPFFERFKDLEAAREGLTSMDSWCFDARGAFWHLLFIVDAARDDLDHFREWSKCLEPFHAEQAAKALRKYRSDS